MSNRSSTYAPEPRAGRPTSANPTRPASWLVGALILAAAIVAAWAFLKTGGGRGPGDAPEPGQRISPSIPRLETAP